jgi:hypothetical protein
VKRPVRVRPLRLVPGLTWLTARQLTILWGSDLRVSRLPGVNLRTNFYRLIGRAHVRPHGEGQAEDGEGAGQAFLVGAVRVIAVVDRVGCRPTCALIRSSP